MNLRASNGFAILTALHDPPRASRCAFLTLWKIGEWTKSRTPRPLRSTTMTIIKRSRCSMWAENIALSGSKVLPGVAQSCGSRPDANYNT